MRAQECGLESEPHPPISSSFHSASRTPPTRRGPETGELPPGASRARRPRLAHLPRRSRSPPVHSRCQSPGARNAKGRERRARRAGRLGLEPPGRLGAKLRAVLSAPRRWAAPALCAGRGAGGRRDAPAQRGAAPSSHTDRRAALPLSRRGSGMRLSLILFLCGKADAGRGTGRGSAVTGGSKSLTPHREAPCCHWEKRRRAAGGAGEEGGEVAQLKVR